MSKIRPDRLLLSSAFYSVQGEGISTGVPSYFVRLGICNLSCGLSRNHMNQIVKEKLLEDGEIIVGDLHAEGKATWTCDSLSQWAWRGEEKDFQYLIDQWKEQGIYEDIKNGTIHIIWTGGEPTIKGHQEAITNFHKYLLEQDADKENPKFLKQWSSTSIDGGVWYKRLSTFNEIETNGTIVIEDGLFKILDQINCSPKLSNSGMTEKQRIVPAAIKRIMEHDNYQFKFVISTEDDVKEIFRDFVEPFSIPLKNVVIMPGMDSQDQYHERTYFILEMTKKYKIRGLSRLHISAYDRVINV
jgi:organic radical activating enzyme